MSLFRMGDIVRMPSRPSEGLFEVVAGTENYDHLSRCNISKDGAKSEIRGVHTSQLTLVCSVADRKDI